MIGRMGGGHLRDRGGRRARARRSPTRAATTSGSRRRSPSCTTPSAPGGSSTTRCRSAAAAATRPRRLARGARRDAVPVERIMRDFRINLIFEGSSEIMHLFIAREAVDRHLKVAGALIDPRALGRREARCAPQGRRVLRRLVPEPLLRLGPLAALRRVRAPRRHVRFTERMSRKLARKTFHAMLRFGPKLEKRQAVLFRLVDVGGRAVRDGGRLLAGARCCGRRDSREAVELADLFCRYARRRVRAAFRTVFDNDDTRTYAVARQVLDGQAHLAGTGDGVRPQLVSRRSCRGRREPRPQRLPASLADGSPPGPRCPPRPGAARSAWTR